MNPNKIKNQISDHVGQWAVVSASNTLISSEVASAYLLYNYGEFICMNLYDKYTLYNSMQASDLARALTAWNSQYNPIDNYDSTEKIVHLDSHGDTNDDRTTGGDDGTHNKITSSALTGTKTEHFVTTFENATPRKESEDTNIGGTENTDDLFTNNKKSRENTAVTIDGTTYTANDIHIEENSKSGNIGTVTTQSMILAECDMRLNPVIKQYLDRFVYQYAIYIGGEWY